MVNKDVYIVTGKLGSLTVYPTCDTHSESGGASVHDSFASTAR